MRTQKKQTISTEAVKIILELLRDETSLDGMEITQFYKLLKSNLKIEVKEDDQ